MQFANCFSVYIWHHGVEISMASEALFFFFYKHRKGLFLFFVLACEVYYLYLIFNRVSWSAHLNNLVKCCKMSEGLTKALVIIISFH